MKRIVASVGMAAIGAALIQNSNAQAVGGDGTKSWTVSAALRGFYDDNANTTERDEIDTFGIQISPTISFTLPLDQTTVSLLYNFDYKWYDESPNAGDDQDTQTHTIAASLLHAFNERTTMNLRDTFIIGSELDVVGQPSDVRGQQLSGDNIRNEGVARVTHQFTPLFGIEAGYANALFDYDDDIAYGRFVDRIEQRINLDTRWTLANNSVLLVGYAFEAGCYTADMIISPINAPVVTSGDRDYVSHYGYAGLEHTFSPDLTGSLKAGARFTDYYQSAEDESTVRPYLDGSLRYTYAQDCDVKVGLSYDQSATDAFSIDSTGSFTTDTDTAVIYAQLSHAITPDLTGNLLGQFQSSTYNGGTLDGDTDQLYILSAGLEYRFNRHVSTTLSYHFDHSESDQVGRSYDRNRVFLGAVFTY
jgi:Putative beta-barrel porin 2